MKSDVEFNLTWTDGVGGTDLDLRVTGAADSGDAGASSSPEERVVLADVQGGLDIQVDPYFVTDPSGSTYTLTATIDGDTDGDGVTDSGDRCPNAVGAPPSGCPDGDGDGVVDPDDVCPDAAGNGADGCPIGATEHVHVYVDGVLTASQDVDTANGPDAFDIPVQVATGTHALRVDWENKAKVLGTTSRTVIVASDAKLDSDGDGVNDAADNCPKQRQRRTSSTSTTTARATCAIPTWTATGTPMTRSGSTGRTSATRPTIRGRGGKAEPTPDRGDR